mmetsp:Transcript_30432/g.33998  ORF Transcript_30432/g.33998 Transcript_30432/m.33998 type:complete len:265 (-) Transcript_30432:49-843(-)
MSRQKSVIVLGSASYIKKEAVTRAWPFASVQALHIPSGVRPQPIGKNETKKGAMNRAYGAKRKKRQANYWIGIENGMWETKKDHWVDGACIVIIIAGKKSNVVLWSDTLVIPPVRPFEKGPNGEWSILKDPHSVLTNGARPRVDFLADTLCKWVSSLTFQKKRNAPAKVVRKEPKPNPVRIVTSWEDIVTPKEEQKDEQEPEVQEEEVYKFYSADKPSDAPIVPAATNTTDDHYEEETTCHDSDKGNATVYDIRSSNGFAGYVE